MEYFGSPEVLASLKGTVLVLPAVAFANVGELAVDVLVTNLRAQLVARLHSDNVLPCVGNDPFTLTKPGTLTTALELYHVPGTSLFILQQRAPAMQGRQAAYAEELVSWIQQQGFSHVLLLSGLDAQLRRDKQIMGSPVRHLSNDASRSQTCEERLQASALESDLLQDELELHSLLQPWPIRSQLEERKVCYVLLTCFAAEGDNSQDGMLLAKHALQYLATACQAPEVESLVLGPLATPCSWVGMYGRTLPRELQ